MSIELMNLVWKTGADELSGAKRMVMLAIADSASDEGVCWPKVRTIAGKAGIGERQAQRIVKQLESDNWLKRVGRVDESNGRQISNKYVLNINRLRGDILSPGEGDTYVTGGGDIAMSPQEPPNKNQSKDNKKEVSKDTSKKTPKEYIELVELWRNIFPEKPQPRTNNKTLSGKLRTRLRSKHFRDNWRDALNMAGKSKFLHESGWFDLYWFLKNDDNYEKCLIGKYGEGYAVSGERLVINAR